MAKQYNDQYFIITYKNINNYINIYLQAENTKIIHRINSISYSSKNVTDFIEEINNNIYNSLLLNENGTMLNYAEESSLSYGSWRDENSSGEIILGKDDLLRICDILLIYLNTN